MRYPLSEGHVRSNELDGMMDPHLQRLVDEDAIRRITALYGDAVTHLDARRAASVYTEDGCVSIAGHEIVGRTAIEDGMRESFAAFSLLQLIEHGGTIRLNGEDADARWSTIELTIRSGSQDLNVIFGRYEDRLVRSAEGWRFRHRRFTLAGRVQLPAARLQMNPDFFTMPLSLSDLPA